MYITIILSRIIIAFMLTTLWSYSLAIEYKMMITFAPGSQSDVAHRHIANSFEKATGNKIIIENLPGAESIVGTLKYKNNDSLDLISITAGQIIFNPVLKKDIPYTDDDFDHLIYVGTSSAVWVTRSDKNIKVKDLVEKMPKFVGGYVSSYNTNLTAFIKEKNVKSEIVNYKGSGEIVTDIINGTIDMGILAINSTLLELVKAGKVSIIGSTYAEDMIIEEIAIPSVSKHTGVTQFNGFVAVATRPGMDPAKRAELKAGLWEALNDSVTKEKLRKLYILSDSSQDQVQIKRFYTNFRNKVKSYIGN